MWKAVAVAALVVLNLACFDSLRRVAALPTRGYEADPTIAVPLRVNDVVATYAQVASTSRRGAWVLVAADADAAAALDGCDVVVVAGAAWDVVVARDGDGHVVSGIDADPAPWVGGAPVAVGTARKAT